MSTLKIGVLEFSVDDFEYWHGSVLEGVIDNGDTLGTIYPLEMFVGTNTPNLATDWNIFPNPAQDFIQLKNFSSSNDIQVTISDINGNIILQQLIKPEDKIDLSPLSSGIYIAEIFDGDKSARKKLIKL